MRYRIAPSLVILAACNRTFGLDETFLVDAAVPDAAPSCDRPLAYHPQLHQAIAQACHDYTIADDGRTLAVCGQAIAEGRDDEPLVMVPHEARTGIVLGAWIAPEGDRAVFQHISQSAPAVFAIHVRDDSGWRWTYDLPVVIDYDDTIGAPSRGPGARIMHARPNAGVVDELVEDAPGAWRVIHSYTTDDLAPMTSLYSVFNLTADGLHVVFAGFEPATNRRPVMHASRTRIEDRFGPATPLEGVPGVSDPLMTADCGRVYFSGLSSIFYARQQ